MFASPFVLPAPAGPAAVVIMAAPVAPIAPSGPPAVVALGVVPELPTIDAAAALEAQAVALGYIAGFPPQLPHAAMMVDLRAVARLLCACCHKRGMQPKPYHRDGRKPGYRIVAACPRCGSGEVV